MFRKSECPLTRMHYLWIRKKRRSVESSLGKELVAADSLAPTPSRQYQVRLPNHDMPPKTFPSEHDAIVNTSTHMLRVTKTFPSEHDVIVNTCTHMLFNAYSPVRNDRTKFQARKTTFSTQT